MSLKRMDKNNGITLVALVVTIVILIILATISISVTFGEGGLIEKAKQSKEDTESAMEKELQDLDELAQEYANSLESEETTGSVS